MNQRWSSGSRAKDLGITAGAFVLGFILIAGLNGAFGAQGTEEAKDSSTTSPEPTSAESSSESPSATSESPSLEPSTTSEKPTPKPSKTKSSQREMDLCGAPNNPYGYNFCGRGGLVYDPPGDVCVYFDCIDYFDEGKGYMVQCGDDTYSMSGGRRGVCSYHDGHQQDVYDG